MGGFAKGGWMGALGGAAGHMPKSGIGGMIGGAMGGFAKGGWMGALGGAAGHLPKTGLGGYLGSAMGGFATGGVGGALTGLAGHLPKTGLGGFAGSALNGFATGGLTGAITGALGHLHVPQIAIGPLTKLAQMGLDRFSKAVGKAIPAIEKLLHTSDHKGAEGKVHGVSSLMELARQAITTLINAAMHDPAHKKQAEALRKAFFEIRAHFQKFVGMLHGLGGELAGGIDAKKYPVLAAIEAAIHALATKAGTLGDAGHADSKQAGAVALLHKAADALHKRLTAAQGKFKKDQAAQAIISGLLAKLGECLAHIGGKGKKGKKTEGDHAQAGGGAHAGHGEGGGGAHGGHPHSGEHPNAHRPKKHKKRKPRRHHRHGRGRGNASHQIAVGGSHGGGDPVGELIGDLQQETGRVFVDRGANRGEGDHSDGQDVDASAGDTWLGSGEGIKNFSDVFGAFLPAEGASKGGGHGKAGHGGHGGGHGGKGHGHGGGAGHQASGEHGEHGGEEHEAHGEGGGGEEGDESGYETPEDGELVEHDGGQGEEGGEGEGGESGEHGGGEGGVGGGGEAPEHGPGGGKGKGGKRRRGKGGGWLGKLKKFGKKVGKLGKVGKFAKKMIGKVTGAFGKGGFFNKLFKGLHGFADKVGKYAKLGQGLLGKGMHYAEMGMGMLDKFGGIAQKVEGFAGKAEGFLDKVGLHGLAGLAGKVGGAAGWASEKSSAGHDLLQKADDLMGQGKKGLGAAGGFAGKAGKAFGAAEHGSFGKLLHLFKASRFGNGIDGKYSPERFKGGSQLDEAKRLDGSTRNRMEEFLGGDFGGVKIHTGQGAAEVTRRYDAEAVTVKDHIFFAPGRFNPNTADGERLIAHELTHVLQKGRPNLDVKTAEGEALHSERAYGNGPARETLNLGKPKADFAFSDGEGAGAATGVHTAKRTRSKGNEGGGQDQTPDGEEFIEKISARVYELLMEELEQAFESR